MLCAHIIKYASASTYKFTYTYTYGWHVQHAKTNIGTDLRLGVTWVGDTTFWADYPQLPPSQRTAAQVVAAQAAVDHIATKCEQTPHCNTAEHNHIGAKPEVERKFQRPCWDLNQAVPAVKCQPLLVDEVCVLRAGVRAWSIQKKEIKCIMHMHSIYYHLVRVSSKHPRCALLKFQQLNTTRTHTHARKYTLDQGTLFCAMQVMLHSRPDTHLLQHLSRAGKR